MGLFDSFDDIAHAVEKYGPSAAIGGGIGLLTAGPPGAVVGATTAVAGQIAGEKASEALPQNTPKPLRTLVQWGVPALFAGPDLAFASASKAGARIALEAALSREAAAEGAKIALTSGVGAVVGQQAADKLGVPEWLGELAGGFAGPMAPGIGRALSGDFMEQRAVAYQSGSPMWKGLAQSFGANEANSAKVSRTPALMDAEKIYGSQADTVTRIRNEVDRANKTIPFFKSQVDDDEVRALTGVTSTDPRAYLAARARGQMPPELGNAGPMTTELRKAQRRFGTLTTQYDKAAGANEQAQSALAALTAPLGEGELVPIAKPQAQVIRLGVKEGAVAPAAEEGLAQSRGAMQVTDPSGVRVLKPGEEPAPGETVMYHGTGTGINGTVKPGTFLSPSEADAQTFAAVDAKLNGVTQSDPNAPMGHVWRSADGIETPLAPEQVKPLQDAQTAANAAQALHERATKSIQTLLGVDALPTDPGARMEMLRQKILGPDLAQVDASLMPQADAQTALKAVTSRDAEQAAATKVRIANIQTRNDRLTRLADFLDANPNFGSLIPGDQNMQQASRDFEAVTNAEDLWKGAASKASGRRYIDLPNEQVMNFEDYAKVVDYVTRAQPNADRAREYMQSMIENPRGSVWVQGAEGNLQPRTLVGIDPQNATALVRSDFQSAAQADTVPLTSVRFRFSPEQMTDLQSEVRRASTMSGLPADGLPQPQALSTRRLWGTRKDYEDAVNRASQAGRPIPPADGIISEDHAQAVDQFKSNFAPPGTTIEMHAMTPKDEENQIKALRNFMALGPRESSTPDERVAFVNAKRAERENADSLYGTYSPVDQTGDPDPLNLTENPTRPNAPFMSMLRQSTNDVTDMATKGVTGWTGSTGQFLGRLGTGIVVEDPRLRSAYQDFYGAQEVSSLHIAATRNFSWAKYSDVVTRKFGVKGGIRTIIGRDGAMQKLLQEKFQPEALLSSPRADASRLGTWFSGLSDVQKPEAAMLFASNPENLVAFPEAFPELANLPETKQLTTYWNGLSDVAAREKLLLGVGPSAAGRKLSMMVTDEYRPYLNPDVLSPSGPVKRQPNFSDIFDSVWEATGGNPDKVRKGIVTGMAAANTGPVADYQAMAEHLFLGKIKALVKPGETATAKDIQMDSRGWHITNLNKWPTELHSSLKGLMDIGNGAGKWAGLQHISQAIALGALSADLSVVGLQGYKYAAQTLMAGHPFRAARVLGESLTHVTSDYGFYSFVRQNIDELTYYSQLGLTGGLRGYIAGPDVNKVPLEHVPYVGTGMNALYGLSDLQYGRAVYYMKVQGIRDNLEAVRNVKAGWGTFSKQFEKGVSSTPLFKGLAENTGGDLNAYFLRSDEDTVKDVVRQVQRSLGSVSLQAEGVGATRQAAEQIMTIVPGFFRGQVGQWASIITKPNTVEGHLALSMLAREYMFGGLAALTFSKMLGTSHLVNWNDPSSATWLGIPVPDHMGGGTIPLIPTMAIPRLATRVVKDSVGVAAGQDNSSEALSHAIDSFAQGRLSPVVSAFYDNIKGKDFLGRKYDSNLEKWGQTLSAVTLPIVMQSAVSDAIDGVKQQQATGTFDWKDMAGDTAANIVGKSLIPTSPAAQLDKLAQSAYENDWNMLTDAEKSNLRTSNPAVAAAEAQYNFYSAQRAGSKESHITAAYNRYSGNIDSVWNQPTMISGLQTTQEQDDQAIAGGQMSGDTWRERYHTRQQAASQYYDQLTQELNAEGLDPDKLRQQRIDRLSENRPEDRAVLLQVAKAEYASVDLPTALQTISTPQGDVSVESADWGAFDSARQDVLNKYPADIAQAVQHSSLADQDPGIAAYQQASQAQRQIESLGRYKGLSSGQGDKVDRMRGVIAAVGDQIRGQAGTAASSIPSSVIQQAALRQMQMSGIITSNDDMQLATLAFAMEKNSKLADAMRNPAQISAILNNPSAAIFYPYLASRVPKVLWPALPPQVFNAPLMEAQLAAAGPS